MDSYPGDLLAGVFPLVFAVNAILPANEKESSRPDKGETANDTAEEPNNDQTSSNIMQDQPPPPPPPPPASKNRGLFDRFLDAMAASLAVEEDEPALERQKSETLVSSFLSHNDAASSSDDDDSLASGGGSMKKRRSFGMVSPRVTHTRLGVLRGSIRSNQVDTPLSTAYARALQLMDGPQGFFQRARIVSVSTRHGFPPSKDPEGNQNKAALLSQPRNISFGSSNANAMRLQNAGQNPNIEGILSAGWLEKHVHALPSVLLVVACFDGSSPEHQQLQDQHICETIEHLRYSLAPKRECRIQLVCLAAADTSVIETDEWVAELMKTCNLAAQCVTVLDTKHDLQGADSPGIPTSPPTRKLIKTVRDASLAYYLGQARRNKQKYGMLGHERRPALLPLAVRYCFKIGIFYEFLLRHEKSTRYLTQAYRHLEHYYRNFVLSRAPLPVMVNPQGDDNSYGGEQVTDDNESDEEGGVEVTLAASPTSESTRYAIGGEETAAPDAPTGGTKSDAPSDMAHQCRGVADWLNLKLLQAGFLSAAFSSSENGGLVAAASQWRRHCIVFLSKTDKANPAWNHWAFVAHQRLVMAQLVERRPPRESSLASTLPGAAKDEVLLRCSAWRNYEAAAEGMLRLGREVQKAKELHTEPPTTVQSDNMRPPFVGGTDSEGLAPKFHEECKRHHKEFALELALHAVSIFENEQKKENERNDEDESGSLPAKSVCRAGARLYYLSGGILLGMKRYEQAAPHLEKAARHAAGWNELELAIRRMLIECYENYLPSQTEATEEQRENITNMILDSYFNSPMSSQNLRRALDNFSSLTGTECLKWNRECSDESDSSMPFSFTVTFPGATHATAGDVVTASVAIKSNLDYAVHINSVTLLSMAGQIPVPSSDLLCAKNANDGSDGGIIIQAKSAILVTTLIDVPKDIDSIASDESGNGGEKEGTPGKGSFAKSARPRAAGLTSAGGARLVNERSLDDNRRERNAQWSLRFLGGKPLRCDGMSLIFYPVHAEKAAASGGRLNLIELTIVHKKPKTHAPVRKTPFEEDNYISSAWSRPQNLPLALGPRCLRVLGPMAQMVVTDLTYPLTNGTAIEGAANRILLKLQAGQKEECRDIKYRIACSNTSLSIDGTTTQLDADGDRPPSDDDKKATRTPLLISNDQGSSSTNCAFELPTGWHIVGSGQGTSNEVTPAVSSLSASESTYIYLDLYRPPAPLVPLSVPNAGGDSDLCQTDFDIAITYRQARPSVQSHGRRKHPGVQHVTDGKANKEESGFSDLVFLEYSGSVLWSPPIKAEFTSPCAGPKVFPSGSSHPSNVCPDENAQESNDEAESSPTVSESTEIPFIDGERVSTRCALTSNTASKALGSEIVKISFENDDGHGEDDEAACDLHLVSDCRDEVLYRQEPGHRCCNLIPGSKFNLAYAIDARIRSQYEESSVSACLGVICVDWKPVGLPLPEGVSTIEGKSLSHGPLVLSKASTVKFRGPRFIMESAPFEASLDSLPASPRLAVPFEVKYRITNNTALHQKLTVTMSESPAEASGGDVSEGLLLSGLVSGEICLSPNETQILMYTALATRAGKMEVPAISVASSRYRTWVVNDPPANSRHVFVLP